MSLSETERRAMFRLFNEIGIVSQLSSSLFNRLMPDGLHLSHFTVLNHLVRLGDGKTPLDIASAMQVTKATMTHTLGVLTERGFVRLAPHATDGRSKLVYLTDAGRICRDTAIERLWPSFDRIAGELDLQEALSILPQIEAFRRVLDAERDGSPGVT